METRWLYRTSGDFDELVEASNYTCVIPMGCVEKHGLHLPLGTDILHASKIAYMASQLETVCVFPDHIFGDVAGFAINTPKGTISLSLELQLKLLEEFCDNVAKQGFKKIFVFNGHGGNVPMLTVYARNLVNKPHEYAFAFTTVTLPAPHMLAEKILKDGSGSVPELTIEDEELLVKYHKENMVIGHACMGEAAFMMGICPEAVKLDRLGIEDGKERGYSKYLKDAGVVIRDNGWDIDFPNSYHGDDPYGCNERIGTAALRFAAESAAHSFKVFKEDENIIKWNDALKKEVR